MSIEGFPILSTVILLPLAGVPVLLIMRSDTSVRVTALLTTVLTFLVSLPLYFGFDPQGGMQFVERLPWIERYGISYYLGLDGISLLLVMLTTFLSPLCVLACWRDITTRVRDFMICWLLLEVGLLGVFLSLDLFLFYVFWEFSLIPMYLIIGVWGSPARRIYSAVKFFIYTMVGSLLMLVAIIFLYFAHAKATGEHTFDLFRLYGTPLSFQAQCLMFLAFALAFAIKVPMFPFHTWLPDAHTEAPTVGSVMLAAVHPASWTSHLSSLDSPPSIAPPPLCAQGRHPSHSRSLCTIPNRTGAHHPAGSVSASLYPRARVPRVYTQISHPVSPSGAV